MKWKVGLQNILVSGVKWHKKTFSELFFRISIDTILYIYTGIMEEIFTPTQRADNRESTYGSDITEELS